MLTYRKQSTIQQIYECWPDTQEGQRQKGKYNSKSLCLAGKYAEILLFFQHQSYNNKMIKFILVVTILLQTANTQEILSLPYFDAQLNNFDETFKCYLEQNAIKGSLMMVLAIWDLYYEWTTSNNLTNPQQAYEVYSMPAHVIVITDIRVDNSLFGELVAKALIGQPVKAVWIVVSNGCIQNCDQLKGFLRDIRSAIGPEKTVGIYSGPEFWSNTFDQKGCPQISQEHPLFYSSTYFPDYFYPFGGWKKAEFMRSSRVTVEVCKVFGDQNSVQYYTKPTQ